MELARKLLRSDRQTSATANAIRPPMKKTTEKHLEKRSRQGNVDSGLQMETVVKKHLVGDKWSVAYSPLGVIQVQRMTNRLH